MDKSMASGSKLPGLASWLCPLLSMWLWGLCNLLVPQFTQVNGKVIEHIGLL